MGLLRLWRGPVRIASGTCVRGSGVVQLKLRLVASTVPDVENLYAAASFRNIVKDPVRPEDDLPERSSRSARVRRTNERKGREDVDMIQHPPPHPHRRASVPGGDTVANLFKIGDGGIGPDYLEFHDVAQDSRSCPASPWLLTRPSEMSFLPLRTAAMMRSSSVISSKVTRSGSRSSASNTACLSVMARGYHAVNRTQAADGLPVGTVSTSVTAVNGP